MKIQFIGAAQTVTGSCFIIETEKTRFAVDCGMHQGNSVIEKRNEEMGPYDPSRIDFFLITHAHIDHTGLLPKMVNEGFHGKIFCTEPTADFLDIMLLDSAHIQEIEAESQNRRGGRKGKKKVDPLYTKEDALKVKQFVVPVEYHSTFEPSSNVRVTYKDAGHILGSAFLEVEIFEEGKWTRLVFSGDLGRPGASLVNDPERAKGADYLFVESTYGDRNHKDENTSRQELAEAIAYSYANRQKVLIPAFALERTQEILYFLHKLDADGKLPKDMPVFLDSPLAIRATEVFRKHPKYFDQEFQEILVQGKDPLSVPNLRPTLTSEESMAINEYDGPAIVIAGSGMCNAGRIKHHLRHNAWKPGASIVFVGYQGVGTPGRSIVDGAKYIRIFGEEVMVKAKVFTINGFSAHAGQSQILGWVSEFVTTATKVFLIHGELEAQKILSGLLKERFNVSVYIPEYLEEVTLEPGEAPVVALSKETSSTDFVDWEFLLQDTEQKMHVLRERLLSNNTRSLAEQADIRDRLVDLNSDLLTFISTLRS